MRNLLRILEPRSTADAIVRIIVLLGLVALTNFVFSTTYVSDHTHDPTYYIAHAVFVGGPFIIFFVIMMMAQVQIMRQLYRQSRKDGMTGLYNRTTFLTIATTRLETTTGGVVLLLDADRFKQVNDEHGHQSGDNCLRSIAETLRGGLRQNDIIGRIGGEEFAIFLSYTTMRQAKMIAERFTKPIQFQSASTAETLTITMSIGAAEVELGLTLDELLARADTCLYQAKEAGRARLVVWQDAAIPEPLAAAV